jgi:hypothetical protein
MFGRTSQRDVDLQEEDARRKEEQRLAAERRALEAERLEQLREMYRRGEESSEMRRATALISWLHSVAGGGWRPMSDEAVPALDGAEAALRLATTTARNAVAAALAPLIADAERTLAAATRERDKFARGR